MCAFICVCVFVCACVYKQDSALNNPQGLNNQIKHDLLFSSFYISFFIFSQSSSHFFFLTFFSKPCCILTFDRAVNQGLLYTGCTCVNKRKQSRGLTIGRICRCYEIIHTRVATSYTVYLAVLESRSSSQEVWSAPASGRLASREGQRPTTGPQLSTSQGSKDVRP